jgi:hypothetical protein
MSNRFDNKTSAQHDKCWERLPWWINGSLSEEQMAEVEEHVSACPMCTSESDALRELQRRMRDDAVLLAPQSGWQGMVERLDREEELLTGKPARPVRRPLVASNGWRWLATGQAALVAGLATTVWMLWPAQQSLQADADTARYVTLTNAAEPAGAKLSLRMVFRRDASLDQVNALLREIPAQIAAGPSEAGVYTVALSRGAESLPSLLTQLRADDRVVFVEPVSR